MSTLPSSIHAHIFRFLSHPASDAIRARISESQAFSSQYGSSGLHTFYMFFFLDKKLSALPQILYEISDNLGFRMGDDSGYFRPCQWQVYESQFHGLFLKTKVFVNNNRACFRSNQ